MICKNPITIRNKSPTGFDDIALQVPCGKCIACRIQKKREWTIRLLHESYFHERTSFVTLTYNDENLPIDLSIRKREMQLFLKRIRKQLDLQDRKIKYYVTGEYGDKSARPHYHGIFFGLDVFDTQLIEKCWPKGFVYIGNVTHDSIQYVAGYIEKKLSGEMAKNEYGEREVPFSIMSRGLGKQYAIENREQIADKLTVTYKGHPVGLPRYYAKILDLDMEKIQLKAQEREEEVDEFWRKKGFENVGYAKHLARQQNVRNIEARLNMLHKEKI